MSQPVVDTLQLSNALRKTGMEREQAEGVAGALGKELGAHVVVQGDLGSEIQQVRSDSSKCAATGPADPASAQQD